MVIVYKIKVNNVKIINSFLRRLITRKKLEKYIKLCGKFRFIRNSLIG